MKAAVLTRSGVRIADVPVPAPARTEILVRVRASSLNRADLYLSEGRVHGTHGGDGTVLGLEWAGDVVQVGEDVQGWQVGDRIMCSGIGGLAEYAVADWRRALPVPVQLSGYEAAACLPIALRTAFVSLADLGRLEPGQSVVVLGASSGVGLMCLRMAKLLGAARVIGTSTKAERRARLASFGADVALDSGDPRWSEQVLECTGGRGADLLIDFLAGPYIGDSMRAVAPGGCIVNVGRMAGESGTFDFDLHSMRRIRYLGQTFRTRTADEVGEIQQRLRARLWHAVEDGTLGLPVDVRFPLARTAEAFEVMRSNAHFGKIVVTGHDPMPGSRNGSLHA